MNQAPSNTQWLKLLEAAAEFNRISPWTWMDDSLFFGIKAPESRETNYCCIMGRGGEHFALAVYRGTEGLHSYIALRDGINGTDLFTTYHSQHCLMASFEDREGLDKADMEIIRASGLKFRGKKQWPQFRSLRPRMVPWYLEAEEADTLTYALAAAAAASLLVKDNQQMLFGKTEEEIPVFSFGKDGSLIHSFTQVPAYAPKSASYSLTDDQLIKRFAKLPAEPKAHWIIRSFLGPSPVLQENRPYFPTLVIWFDTLSDRVLHIEAVSTVQEEAAKIFQNTLGIIEHIGIKPGKLIFTEPELQILFGKLCEQIELNQELQPYNEQIDAVIEDFHLNFGK